MVEKIIVFIFGSLVGSFLNVCIHRLPRGESIVKPRSHCPKCKKSILWYDNIPFLSYIVLRGKCRFCKQKISFRYLLIESVTAAVFLLFFSRHGLSFDFFFYTIFVSGLIVATFVDIQHRIIPDEISLGGIAVGFLFSIIKNVIYPIKLNLKVPLVSIFLNPPPILDSFLGILLGGGILYLTGKGFDFIYFKLLKKPPIDGETESMGGGDIKLLAMIGAFLGWKAAILTFFIAPFFGAIVGIVNLSINK
jgi:leader peptidase (prepilin peptidase)/N-methyltransferase